MWFRWNSSRARSRSMLGIREEELRRTALDDRPEQVGVDEVLAALRREEHGGVALAPGLERLGDVGLDVASWANRHASSSTKSFSCEAASAS